MNQTQSNQIKPKQLALYYSPSCFYCLRVLDTVDDLGIHITQQNIHRDQSAYNALKQGGGKTQVPCLRIDHGDSIQWLYESADIVTYIEQHVSHAD